MSSMDILYNVNEIIVDPGLECSYREFSFELNNYLLEKYGEYYLGLQLYESDENPTYFHVVAAYENKYGLDWIIGDIQDDISNIYDCEWGDTVIRNSVFSFTTSTRVIPPLC